MDVCEKSCAAGSLGDHGVLCISEVTPPPASSLPYCMLTRLAGLGGVCGLWLDAVVVMGSQAEAVQGSEDIWRESSGSLCLCRAGDVLHVEQG